MPRAAVRAIRHALSTHHVHAVVKARTLDDTGRRLRESLSFVLVP